MSDIPLLDRDRVPPDGHLVEHNGFHYTTPTTTSPTNPRHSASSSGFSSPNLDGHYYESYHIVNTPDATGAILPPSQQQQQQFQNADDYQPQQQQHSSSHSSNSRIQFKNQSGGFDNNNNNNSNNTYNYNDIEQNELRQTRVSLYASMPDVPPTAEDMGITADTSSIEAKHKIQNHMFGFRPFKSKIYKKRLEDLSPEVRTLYNASDTVFVDKSINTVGNYLYSIFFGSVLFVVFALVSLLLFITYFGIPYAKITWNLKGFVFWPFGKYLQKLMSHNYEGERQPLRRIGHHRSHLNVSIVGTVIWYILGVPFLLLAEVMVIIFTWMIVIMIPTAKTHFQILKGLLTDPLSLRVESTIPRTDSEIILFPVEAFNLYYYKFTVSGLNVCLVNLLPFVILSLVFGYFLESHINPVGLFVSCLLSTIPLSYYNGMAIASLSAQTSFAIGALINASFGSMIELILYVVTINGAQEDVARSAITGSLLGALLLIPGLSMVIGGIKHKEQRFNPAVMGVSTVLLMVAVVGTFTPTIFYKIYGAYNLTCGNCVDVNGALNCASCAYVQNSLDSDPVYTGKARTLMYIVSAFLPLAYIIGLLFTLKTHTHILHPVDGGPAIKDEHHVESDGTEVIWSKKQCIVVLLLCTTMFALVSDKMVEAIDPVVSTLGLTHEFLGVTILGIIPSAAEYLNAIQFAIHNNMPLSLEIGASAAVQITLFQMPVLVYICAIINHLSSKGSFTLIFPFMDFFVVFFSVVVMNLVFTNGKTNYFIGSILVIVYLIIVVAFYFTPT
ncbi:hypothetical protein SAMD00019534_041050 [Acytostelium subglobosum LB1]|uniref:hypothetical protein n=1 Tax=Acytostelium subglobosum LB1 TaxID=1410327 RepID=UPI0006448520|nr:hypothetical protein SAMD00019534_041050 [Acytostelium subglobosum LB1]GAM20930.1 hypothetical protein SAMD00019534_041050 [Acytostelium subglobosum LB1]|eukprot:XP_012756064.1 hypothetical protein SAMD00019534_041050 [Acytostelium subglobosum LB1]